METSDNNNKVICLLNPRSCDGASLRRWPELEVIFKELGISYELVTHEGDLREKLLELLESGVGENANFAGLGGDGTQNALFNGLMEYKEKHPDAIIPKYTIIPLGTGNNLAKSFGMGPKQNILIGDLKRALNATVRGATYELDLGKQGGRYFADAFASGVDAHILDGRDKDKAKISRNALLYRLLRGYPLYAINLLKSMLGKFKPMKAEIEVDGKTWHSGQVFNIIINNTRIYGGEFDPTDNAFANDGQLDILISTKRSDYLIRSLLSYRRLPRKLRSLSHRLGKSKQHIKGSTFRIKWDSPAPAQVDGEIIESSDTYLIEIAPRALKINVPVEPS